MSLLQHGELEGRGGPRAPLLRRRRPAADGLPGHRENLPGTPDRDPALPEEGYKVKIITKTHSSVQNFGMQAETADHWARSTVRNGYCNIDWLVAEEITQLDTALWASP